MALLDPCEVARGSKNGPAQDESLKDRLYASKGRPAKRDPAELLTRTHVLPRPIKQKLEGGLFLSQELGGPSERLPGPGIQPFERRDHLAADPIAGEANVLVREVLPPGEAGAGRERNDVRAARLNQGANVWQADRPDSDEACSTRPANEVEQDRLRPIVARVTQGDPGGADLSGRLLQEGPPKRAARLLESDPPALCVGPHILFLDHRGKSPRLGKPADELGVPS